MCGRICSRSSCRNILQKALRISASLIKEGKLKSAAPLDTSSKTTTDGKGIIKDGPFNETKEVIAGYFHIVAENMEEAVEIAKANPIFSDIPTKIEVHLLRPIGG